VSELPEAEDVLLDDTEFEAFGASGDFENFEDFDTFDTFAEFNDTDHAYEQAEPVISLPSEAAPADDTLDVAGAPTNTDDDAIEGEAEYTADTVDTDDTDVFEAGIESWESASEESVTEDPFDSFEDDFDAIRAAVEGLSFATQDEGAINAPGTLAENDTDSADPLSALDGLEGLDEAHTEARESDIFDDEEFESLELPSAEAPAVEEELQDEGDADLETEKQLDADTADYLTRARRAAMAATSSKGTAHPARSSTRPSVKMISSGGSSRLPLIAAASAVAVAGVAAGGYLYLRGKQEAPALSTPVSTYVDPETTDAAASSLAINEEAVAEEETLSTAEIEQDLFGETAPSPQQAQYAAIPPVVTVQAAAASGNYIAQYQLAQEKLTSGDYADGADLMRKAAQKGLPIAQYALAKLHERGTGVPKDLTLAREWTEKAAAGGNVKAMHDLAVFMAEGEGGEQTYAGAVEWFRKGAEYGVVDSQYNLGVLYEQGLGISPNLTESLFWFDVANRNGDGGAPAKISELIERVSPEAAAQARSRAASWQPAAANAIANGRFGAQPWNIGNPLQVQAVQKALNALGYAAGTPDGIMGNGTAMAIRDYQRANGLPVTGTVTAELIDRLNAGASYGG